MIVYRASSRISLTLDTRSPLGVGGEAKVLPVLGADSLVAKIYHQIDRVDEAKLRVMIANPPSYPDGAAGHALIAWPIDLLADAQDRIRGFLMPRVIKMRPLIDFYNPSRRRKNFPLFSYRYLHRMAQNLATAFKVLHSRGYVIGDVNQVNILGNEQALVTLVDADSFQVSDGAGRVFRCTVGTPEFTPPELSGKSFGQIDRAPEHDLFGLGVLIFRLLMGVHPFDGRYLSAGDPPLLEQRIASGHFVYGRQKGAPYSPPANALPIEVIDPALRALIEQCFSVGSNAPSKRPDAAAWKAVLSDAEERLMQCPVKPLHFYGRHLNACPWCERARLLGGQDPFAPPASVLATRIVQPQANGSPAAPPGSQAAKRGRWVRVDLLGFLSVLAAAAGFFAGQWALLLGAVATTLGFLGTRTSRQAKKGAAISILGTVLGLCSSGFGAWLWGEQHLLAEHATDDARQLEETNRAAEARRLEELSRTAKPRNYTEIFVRGLCLNDVSGASDTWGPGPATTSLRKEELNNLYFKIKDLGPLQRVEFPECKFNGSECYLEGIATFQNGRWGFTAHVSTGSTPYWMASFSFHDATGTHLPVHELPAAGAGGG